MKAHSLKYRFRAGLFSISIAIGVGGCAAATVGAGAAAGIAYTDRGAKGDVKGNVQQVNEQAKDALKQMGIQLTGSEMKEAGKEQSLSGKSGDTNISVNMKSASPNTTSVEVIARESAVKWNKDYAKKILTEIINQG